MQVQVSAPRGPVYDAEQLLCASPEIHQEVDALRAENERLQALLAHSVEAMWLWPAGLELQPCNTLAATWQASVAEDDWAALVFWAGGSDALGGEYTAVWSAPERRVVQARCAALPGGVRAMYLRDISQVQHAHCAQRSLFPVLDQGLHAMAPDRQIDLLSAIRRKTQSLIVLINEAMDVPRLDALHKGDITPHSTQAACEKSQATTN